MPERFSASVAGRHMACHASANLPAAIPHYTPPVIDSTDAANRGTTAHSHLEKLWEYSAREIAAFAATLQYVADLRSTRRFKVLIEQEMTAAWLATKPTTKADLVLHTNDEIHVVDTKWGKIRVEVVDNEQLLYYAVTYGVLAPKAKGVTVHILQPNCTGGPNMESWFIDTVRLQQFMADAQAAETAIQNGDVSFGPTDHHCTFCPANPHSRGVKGHPLCPAMMGMLYPPKLNEAELMEGL